MGKYPDLSGQQFGRLTVIRRSDKRGSRGKRTTPLWECRCACGAITYKATDILRNSSESMCAVCAGKNGARIARESAGYIGGTQLKKIMDTSPGNLNTSGCRGVYSVKGTEKYRARLKFQGKTINLGTFDNFDDAVKARMKAEEEYFGSFLIANGIRK